MDKLRGIILQDLDWKELLWIVFSFHDYCFVFSSFKQTLIPSLTTSVLINISFAFGFGFTFERTLELATRLKPIFASKSVLVIVKDRPELIHGSSLIGLGRTLLSRMSQNLIRRQYHRFSLKLYTIEAKHLYYYTSVNLTEGVTLL